MDTLVRKVLLSVSPSYSVLELGGWGWGAKMFEALQKNHNQIIKGIQLQDERYCVTVYLFFVMSLCG